MIAETTNLLKFCRINKNGVAYDIIDAAIAEEIITNYKLMVIAGKPWIYREGVYEQDENGLFVQHYIKNLILWNLRNDTRTMRVYRLVLKDIRLQVKIEDVNKYPSYWINFKNGMLDVKNGKIYPHSPEYKSIFQIPHNYHSELDIQKSVFYEFLQSRINEDNQQMLYEAAGHCLLPDVVFQKFLVLVGNGNNGKTVILNQITRILGEKNVSAIKLQELSDRFTTEKLLGKQANICADIPNTALKDTSTLKLLTGQDLVKAEYKGGEVFFFRNKAKFLFSCNELPSLLDDRSNGFFRRLQIIRFPEQGKFIPDLYEKLAEEHEVEILISYLVSRVKLALERGKLYESRENIAEISKLREESDTVQSFLNNATTPNKEGRVRRPDLFAAYIDFCKNEDRIPLGKVAFFKALRTKGCNEVKSCGENYICGLELGFMQVEETPFDD